MGTRRRSRELAMQALFYLDTCETIESSFELFCKKCAPSDHAGPFFLRLVNGVLTNKSDLDAVIQRFSNHWKISRMPCVDRNVLRIGIYELLYCEDIPDKVSINEAIEIGKKFGTGESGAFINGILDSILIAMKEGMLNKK